MIIYINGRGMNAPELKAYISELEAENAELRAKVESADRQKAEYKRLLKAAVEDMNINDICDDVNICNVCTEKNCISCDAFHWRYTDEALVLIGEEGGNNA